jgi:uncharacterized protein
MMPPPKGGIFTWGMAETARATTAQEQRSRAFWLKYLHQWHWISAAGCLIGMILFSITGLTLNHANWVAAKPQVESHKARLPEALRDELQKLAADKTDSKGALPAAAVDWLDDEMSIRATGREAEWSEDEIYVSLPRPGGDAWATLSLETGEVTHEVTDRGWISYFNDLHKGRNAGPAWSLFIDVFAIAALVFASTGLLLLKMHSTHRPATWPMVGLGLVLPLLIAMLLIH